MKVIICDDDKVWAAKARAIIEAYAVSRKIEVILRTCANRNGLFENEEEQPDVLFIDIELGGESGIVLAKEVNQRWPECAVVYLTNYLYYAMDVYETEHTYFILKEQLESRIDGVFHKISEQLEDKDKKLVFHTIGGGDVVIDLIEILYLEREGRKTKVTTAQIEFYIWEKLDEILEQLSGNNVIRCHNSYLVYLPAVLEYRKKSFIMKNGKSIDISRSYAKAVQEAFVQWVMMQGI